MSKYTNIARDIGSALKVITKIEQVAVRGKVVDLLKLECGHEVVSRMLGHHQVGKRTHCSQCRR